MIAFSKEFTTRCMAASCRSCGNKGLLGILDLGKMPLADGLLGQVEIINGRERKYPLEFVFCPECSLVQIIETVPPEVLFGNDYPYYSSFSEALLKHSRKNALNLIETRQLTEDSFVVEVASNDGYLLKNFVESGITVLGIDPAPGPAEAAQKIGVPTLVDFFGVNLARRLRHEGKKADVIIANNVFAHVEDTNGFVAAIGTLLKDDGVAVIEVPYLRKLIDNCEFDTIYHEHLCYFSVTAVDKLSRRHGLYLNKVELLNIHGGSMRLYLELEENPDKSVTQLLSEEKRIGMDQFEYYQTFARRARVVRHRLKDMLNRIKQRGHTIAAYGAAAKGAILLNYTGVNTDTVDFVVDRNIHKQGMYMPGVHIPIHEPDRILKDMPDYVLLLPWNFKNEILKQCSPYRKRGGRFIIPIPKPSVV